MSILSWVIVGLAGAFVGVNVSEALSERGDMRNWTLAATWAAIAALLVLLSY